MSFLVLEGIDGSGTTTQAARLADALAAMGREVVLTREPTTGPVGRFLRTALSGELLDGEGAPVELDWSAMALLFASDRVDHLRREIEPALSRGAVVISDRYDLSSLIYQSATCPKGEAVLPWLIELNKEARRPDLTLVLDVPADLAEARRAARAEKPEIYEKSELQRRLASFYKRSPSLLPNDRILVLSGVGTLEEVGARLLSAVKNLSEFGNISSSGG